MTQALPREIVTDEVEFIPAEGMVRFGSDADFEEEFGDFSEERIKVVGGSDCIGTSGFCNDCTC
ncbi:hypothetical protein [Labedaea rhizosphaerae]|uniref:Uncharacterized protein n=1 Tax=Labedaea rhizosphaerae TaxID=598644 RepID=A0A4R6S101_LABRH|nr:hypothetical protein [Labedaea rhizosphaerae]TDP92903.1 hypothetical protein EV186_107138 [Labedaea rhizosphaerae]